MRVIGRSKHFGYDTTKKRKFHDSLDWKLTCSLNPAKSFLFGDTYRMLGFGSQAESESVAIVRKCQKYHKFGLAESWVGPAP